MNRFAVGVTKGVTFMAYYHLTVKTDTKPDGSKIIATNKVAYNNREGAYADIDEERMVAHQDA